MEHVDPARIHLSKGFQSVKTAGKSNSELIVTFTDGTTTTADLLLGADGIHSAVRRFFVPTSAPIWTGRIAFRSVFPISHVAHIPDLPDEAIHTWGPERHLFLSKLGRDLFTVVGTYQADPDDPEARYKNAVWDTEGDLAVLKDLYKDWSPLARAIIDATPYTRVYPNTAGHGLDSWVLGGGRVTVAGDAAHAHGGAFAAGGSLAIDDAWAFAAALRHVYPETAVGLPSDADIARALKLYENTRKAHTDRVLRTVHAGNTKKVKDVRKVETDEELRVRIKGREDPYWIHEHDVEGVFQKVLADEAGNQSINEQARL